MNYIVQSLAEIDDPDIRQRLFGVLYELQTQSGMLLPNLNLQNGEVKTVGQFPVTGSGFVDVWKGLYLNNEKVKIIMVRVPPDTEVLEVSTPPITSDVHLLNVMLAIQAGNTHMVQDLGTRRRETCTSVLWL